MAEYLYPSHVKVGENRFRERYGLDFEEFQVGQVFKHRPGLTITQQDNIEDAFGHFKFLIFYLACAVLAALAHLLFNLDGNGPLIGASGAVAGVMGAYILLYPHARVFVLARIVWLIPLPVPAFWMLGFWIATQLFFVVMGSDEPVAWWAHLGGFAAGLVLAPLFKSRNVPLFGGR